MKKQRLHSELVCHCGSRCDHLFDMSCGVHFATCQRRQHRRALDRAWAPTLTDHFCACGGLYLATQQRVCVGPGVEVMRDLACPACGTTWRMLAPPEVGPGGQVGPHPAMALLLSNASDLAGALREAPRELLRCVRLLRAISEGPPVGFVERFLRNSFGRWRERPAVPRGLPEREQFVGWVDSLKPRFAERMAEEGEAGLLAWR